MCCGKVKYVGNIMCFGRVKRVLKSKICCKGRSGGLGRSGVLGESGGFSGSSVLRRLGVL